MLTIWQKFLQAHQACPEAVEVHFNELPQAAWETCQRGDWMLWVAARKIGNKGWPSHGKVVLMACAVARRSIYTPPEGPSADDIPLLKAIEVAERWANHPTQVNLDHARAMIKVEHPYDHPAFECPSLPDDPKLGQIIAARIVDLIPSNHQAEEYQAQADLIRSICIRVGE